MQIDPTQLARLAKTTLDGSVELAAAWDDARPELSVPATAFGALPGMEVLHRAQLVATEEAGTAVGRLVDVHEGDVDRLYRVAFACQQGDLSAGQQYHRVVQRASN
jgi:hypothetical protein